MPTKTYAITAGGDDGYGRMETTTGWANIATGTYTDAPDGSGLTGMSKIFVGGTTFRSSCTFLRFSAASDPIPADGTITAANLLIHCLDKSSGGDADYAADFFDYGGSPSTSADWEVSSSGDAIATITRAQFTVGVVATIALTGFSGISKSGITGLRLAAKTGTAPTLDDWIDFSSFEAAGQEPRLEVTYTEASAPVPKLRTIQSNLRW